jgi:Virus neck protein
MATSHYFNNYSPSTINEQRLLEDLIVESIKIMGHDAYYIPRTAYDSVDQIFGEIQNSKFTAAYMIEIYLANVQGYEGDGDFFSKFGLEIRDTSNFVLSRRSFDRYIPTTVALRPREGDLLYVPVLNKLFEIKFVEEELMFFSLGKRNPYIYELRCEMFRFSNETIETGVEEIDEIEKDISYSTMITVANTTGTFYDGEIVYQGNSLVAANSSAEVKDFDTANNKLYLINIKGRFVTTSSIRGVTSNTTANVIVSETLGDYAGEADYENKVIEDIADTLIINDFNPLGSP